MRLRTQFLLFFILFAALSQTALTLIVTGISSLEMIRGARGGMDNTAAWVLQSYRDYTANIEQERQGAIDNYLAGIAEDLWFQVDRVHTLWKNGEISLAERDREVRRIILSARIRNTGYAFGLDSAGVLVIHPMQPGRDLSAAPHIREMIRRKNGRIAYRSITAEREKIVVYRWYEPLDLIIAPGVHKEEMTDLYNRGREEALRSDLVQLLTRTRINTKGFLILVSPDGRILVQPEECPIDESPEQIRRYLGEDIPSISGLILPHVSGTPYYIYPASPSSSGNRVIIYIPKEEIRSHLIKMGWILAIMIAGSTIIVIATGVPMSDRITRPLTLFAEKADALAAGQYDIRLPEPGPVLEIRQLGTSLTRMAETIRQRDLDLEERVADRTRRLEALYQVSGEMIRAQDLDELLAAVVEGFPIPAVNRAVLTGVRTGKRGMIESILIKASWHSGKGRPPLPPGTEFPPRVSRALTPFFKKEPVIFANVSRDPALPASVRHFCSGLELAGIAAFPLWYKKDLAGILFLESEEEYHFTEEELRPYHSTLGQLTAAVENQFLIRELSTAKEQAEQASDAKSLFLANISHELRTPLNAILGFSRLLNDNHPGPEKQSRYLEIILQSGNHLLNLINDILDISRIEAGRVTLDLAQFDTDRLISEVRDMVEHRIREKGLSLRLVKGPGVPDRIRADYRKLNQVLINLIGNAIKYTDSGEIRLTITLPQQDAVTGPVIRFEVADTGIGIPEQDQDRIFQPFEQIGKNRTARGTGLGLAISLQYARLMQGNLTVTSQPGAGAVFCLEIPLPDEEPDTGD